MTFMIKYKEQMNKISVDNDMKKRVMNKIKENYKEEPIYRGRTFYKYGGFIAACCAFTITYGITLNNPELISQKDIHINDDQYSFENQEEVNLNYTEDNIEQQQSDEAIENRDIKKYSYNDVGMASEDKGGNESEDINTNTSKDISSNNSLEDIRKTSYSEENINNENDIDIVDNSKINNNSQEDAVYKEIQENEDKLYENHNIKTASYEEDLISKCDLPENVPDLSEVGFDMVYLNQMSKNKLEIMYSDNDRNLWIKVYDKEIIDLENEYSIISNVEYNGKEVFLCTDKAKDTQSLIYIKNNYVYCISSDINMNESFIEEIMEYI